MADPIITTQNVPANPVTYSQIYKVLSSQCATIANKESPVTKDYTLVADGDGWFFAESAKEWHITPLSTTLSVDSEIVWTAQDGELSADDQYILEDLVANLVNRR